MQLSRRRFVSLAAASAASAALPAASRAMAAKPVDFSFLFITDCHLQPEFDGVHGVDLALKRAARTRAVDFAIQGGDHVFDALGVPEARAVQLFDQYEKTEQTLGMRVHHTLGNHDCFGVYPRSGAGPADPLYGKKMFSERFGPTYYAFDHKGVHFVVLDSIGITPARDYEAAIDDAQLGWLAADLAALKPGTPVIAVTHIPLVTAVLSYNEPDPKHPGSTLFHNGPAVIRLLERQNTLAVLQGHTHVNEEVVWHGVPFLTGGAVCGNWWHGTRLGTPEGYTVVSVAGGKVSTRYEPSGFRSVAPENT